MERTIYSKYSNERAERFRIRTDIVTDEAGEKKVYKYACTIQAGDHIRRQEELGKQLDAAYAGSRITFCPCTTEDVPGGCRSVSPFVQGDNLQHLMEQAVEAGDWENVEQMVAAYADRVSGSGGEIPFDRTPEFAEVFGEGKLTEGIPCATVSGVVLIFSNIFVESGKAAADSAWTVIDYEWTFPFPVPKKYLIYRAVYYAYYQIFKAEGKSLADWLKSAGLTEEETECFARMEEHFQEYLRAGAFPVRSMQRRMGTRIIPFAALLEGAGAGDGGEIVRESAYLRVRKLLYHIDRAESQDGSRVCSGWAESSLRRRLQEERGRMWQRCLSSAGWKIRSSVLTVCGRRRRSSAFAFTFPWATGKASMRDKREGLLCTNQKKRFRQSCCFWRI